MNHGKNGGSNQTHKEVDQPNPKEGNGSQSEKDIRPHGLGSKSSIQDRGEQIEDDCHPEGLESNLNPPIENDIVSKGPDSKISAKERGEQASFEIQPEGPYLNIGKAPIEDQTKEVIENEIKNSNLKKSDIRKEEEVGYRSLHTISTYSKEELISIFQCLYGGIELLFLALEPRSIIPNYSKDLEKSKNNQDIEYTIIQILILFKKIDDFQKSSPNSRLPKDQKTLKVWQKAYFELKDQETEERNQYSLILREIILGVTQNDFRPISKKEIK